MPGGMPPELGNPVGKVKAHVETPQGWVTPCGGAGEYIEVPKGWVTL